MGYRKGLFAKQMTRKEFFQHVGLMILAACGVSNFLTQMLDHKSQPSREKSANKKPGSGFGSNRFGA